MKRLILILISLMSVITSFAKEYYCVNADILNVRSQPSKNGQIIGSIRNGEIVEGRLNDNTEGWIYIKTDRLSGYVSSQYLEYSHSEENKIDKSSKDAASKLFDLFESISVPNIGERLMTFIIILLLILQIIFAKSDDTKFTWVAVLLMVILSIAELYYLLMENVDETWFFKRYEVGWLGCIIGFLGFGFFLYGQFIAIIETLKSIKIKSGVYVNWLWGIFSWMIGAILLLVISLFKINGEFLFTIFILYQIGFCLYVLIMNIMEKHILNGILYSLFYLLIMAPFTFLLLLFLSMVIIVALVLFILGAICGGASSSSRSGGDVTLEDGTELRETGVNTYEDSYGHRWSRNGDRFSRED